MRINQSCEHSQEYTEDTVKIYHHFWEHKVYGSVVYSLYNTCNLQVLLELFAMIQITMKYFNYNLDFVFLGKKLKLNTKKQECLHTDLIMNI